MFASTSFRRFFAFTGCWNGSLSLGAAISPASVAAWFTDSCAGGRLDAVRALAEVHGVEVLGEDLLLRELLFELPGEGRLVDLALQGGVRADVQLLHQLLRDGRASLDDASGRGVDVSGANDRTRVHPVVAPEALVFDRHHRLLDRARHLVVLENDPVLFGMQLRDQLPVRGEQEGRLWEVRGLVLVVGQLRQGARLREQRHACEGGADRSGLHRSFIIGRGADRHW
jgi:hypothetical protein